MLHQHQRHYQKGDDRIRSAEGGLLRLGPVVDQQDHLERGDAKLGQGEHRALVFTPGAAGKLVIPGEGHQGPPALDAGFVKELPQPDEIQR